MPYTSEEFHILWRFHHFMKYNSIDTSHSHATTQVFPNFITSHNFSTQVPSGFNLFASIFLTFGCWCITLKQDVKILFRHQNYFSFQNILTIFRLTIVSTNKSITIFIFQLNKGNNQRWIAFCQQMDQHFIEYITKKPWMLPLYKTCVVSVSITQECQTIS